jgi:hypothetical protein
MTKLWRTGGFVFATATIVMLISLFITINEYYFKDYDYVDTLSETCSEAEILDPGDELNLLVCQPHQKSKYIQVWGALTSAGLAIVCFAKDSETNHDSEQSVHTNDVQQPIEQQYQQPPQY